MSKGPGSGSKSGSRCSWQETEAPYIADAPVEYTQ